MHNLTPSTLAIALGLLLSACTTAPPEAARRADPGPTAIAGVRAADIGSDVALYALGLIDTGYRFGGKNPQAGLDCSGMVSYVVEQVSGKKLPYNAAGIAERTRPVSAGAIRPGDLVFFNTLGRAYSHMGIYVGDGKFIHAPNSRGKVRVDRLDNRYFADRFEGARTLLPEG